METAEALALVSKWIEQSKIYSFEPYPWQLDHLQAGLYNPERMIMAGNRTGKTFTGAAEATYHATGNYPDWWKGKRFDRPTLGWTASITNETSRDIIQKALVGDPIGTGAIPGDKIVGKPSYRQAGISDVIERVRVRHVSGGESTILFKTYDQGWRKFQGAEPEWVWLDEEPTDYRIYTECLTRILTSHGSLWVTFTPLLGETDLVRHFTNPSAHGVHLVMAGWEDAPHLDVDERKRLEASFPEHEREARTKGIPMLGTGRVFLTMESEIVCDPFPIPDQYFRICGIDFGIDHPAAAVWLAFDRDRDIVYVYDCYRAANQMPVYHVHSINTRGKWIPVSWPHDGMQRGKADGVPLKDQYVRQGANLLSLSARYNNDVGGGQPQEPVILEINERMATGRWKVFRTCNEWLSEYRSYHRDENGKIVAKGEDTLKASFYAYMMQRYARQNVVVEEFEGYDHPVI